MNRDKIKYSILKEVEKGKIPRAIDYELSQEQFGNIVEEMLEKDYLDNVYVIRAGIGNIVKSVLFKSPKIKSNGYKFLEDHNFWSKAYSLLKEIREWI